MLSRIEYYDVDRLRDLFFNLQKQLQKTVCSHLDDSNSLYNYKNRIFKILQVNTLYNKKKVYINLNKLPEYLHGYFIIINYNIE